MSKKFNVEITGATSMLQNRFIMEQLDTTKKKLISGKLAEVKNKVYTNADGSYYVPSVYLEGAMIEAGKNFKSKGKGTLSKIMGSMLSVNPDAITILTKKGKSAGYEIDKRTAVNPMTKGRMIVERPCFKEWVLKFDIIVDTDEIPTERIKEILDWAGLYVGIGDYRPAKKGKFGKFIVTSFEEVA